MSESGGRTSTHAMVGLEVDNLLAILALLGLLRALETSRPSWLARASWSGPPWRARLHLAADVTEQEVAEAASAGIVDIASHYDADGRSNVKFDVAGFRGLAKRLVGDRADPIGGAFAAALAAEWPEKRAGGLPAAPLVMLSGQGHQNFLDRLVAVPRGDVPSKLQRRKRPPDMRDPRRVSEALFAPWRRMDAASSFRWDPDEDQRYALRFDKPSDSGAAQTVVGANRLAAIGFLSFPCFPGTHRMTTPGVSRHGGYVEFVWPVWTQPLGRSGVERLLGHPAVLATSAADLRPLGVALVYRARRISNGRYRSVARARPT